MVQRYGPGTPGMAHEHLSELREPHLRSLSKLLGVGYRRLTSIDVTSEAMLDAQLAQKQAVATDVRWVPALLGLLALVWRFAPDGLRRRRWQRA